MSAQEAARASHRSLQTVLWLFVIAIAIAVAALWSVRNAVVYLAKRVSAIEVRELDTSIKNSTVPSCVCANNRCTCNDPTLDLNMGPKPTWDEIQKRWQDAPCEQQSENGRVYMNGISSGDEVCRIDRLERLMRRLTGK